VAGYDLDHQKTIAQYILRQLATSEHGPVSTNPISLSSRATNQRIVQPHGQRG